MFDSLKKKIKGLFNKAPESIAEQQAPAQPSEEPIIQQPVQEVPETEPVSAPVAEQQPVAEPVTQQPVAEPIVQQPVVEVPKAEPIIQQPAEEKVAEIPKTEPVIQQPVQEMPKAEPVPEIPKPEIPKAEPVAEKPSPEIPKKTEPAKVQPKTETPAPQPAKKYVPTEPPADVGLTDSFFGGKKIKEAELEDLLWELEVSLLEADVALPVVDEIKEGVKQNLLGKKYGKGHTLEEVVELSLRDAIRNILKNNVFDFDEWIAAQSKPTIIMFVGINGTGKTTAIAKIANRMMKKNQSVVLAAADTFRAGAIEQLTIHSDKLGCKIIKHAQDADPAAVAYDAVDHAKSKNKDVVLIDTAGRMQTNNNLINEMKKIVKVAKPALKIFVGDSLAGNNATEQAKVFDDAIGIDAVILTKIDADNKGGAALSIAHTIGKPIAFVCNGQEYDDIVKFNADWMLDRLFE